MSSSHTGQPGTEYQYDPYALPVAAEASLPANTVVVSSLSFEPNGPEYRPEDVAGMEDADDSGATAPPATEPEDVTQPLPQSEQDGEYGDLEVSTAIADTALAPTAGQLPVDMPSGAQEVIVLDVPPVPSEWSIVQIDSMQSGGGVHREAPDGVSEAEAAAEAAVNVDGTDPVDSSSDRIEQHAAEVYES